MRVVDQYRKHAAKEKKNMAFATQAYKDNPSRYNLLQFVKAFIISSACSFSIGENPNVRHCLSIMCPDNLDVEQLNKMVSRVRGGEIRWVVLQYMNPIPWMIGYLIGC